MTEQARLYEVWVYLQAEPLFWLTLTIGAYLVADKLYQSSGLFPAAKPCSAINCVCQPVLDRLRG